MIRPSKIHPVPFVNIQLLASNDREHTPERLLNQEILATAPEEGQRVPAILVKRKVKLGDTAKPDKDGNIYEPAAGNSRFFTLNYLGERGVVDPRTNKVDANGVPIPGTGKPFSTLDAFVYEDVSEEELARLVNDNTVVPLTILEIARKIIKLKAIYKTERATLTACFGNLLQVFPPTGKTLIAYNEWLSKLPKELPEDQRQRKILEYHVGDGSKAGRLHGQYNVILHAYSSGTSCKLAFEERLRGKQNWPTDGDIHKLYTEYNADADATGPGEANCRGQVTPDTPGPKYLAKWAEIMNAVETAKLNGTTTVKGTSMMSQDQVKNKLSTVVARSIKLTLQWVLNKMSGDLFDEFEELQSAFEKGTVKAEEYSAKIDTLFDKVAAANSLVTPESLAADKAATDKAATDKIKAA